MDPENVQKYQTYLVFLGYFQNSEQHNLELGLRYCSVAKQNSENLYRSSNKHRHDQRFLTRNDNKYTKRTKREKKAEKTRNLDLKRTKHQKHQNN